MPRPNPIRKTATKNSIKKELADNFTDIGFNASQSARLSEIAIQEAQSKHPGGASEWAKYKAIIGAFVKQAPDFLVKHTTTEVLPVYNRLIKTESSLTFLGLLWKNTWNSGAISNDLYSVKTRLHQYQISRTIEGIGINTLRDKIIAGASSSTVWIVLLSAFSGMIGSIMNNAAVFGPLPLGCWGPDNEYNPKPIIDREGADNIAVAGQEAALHQFYFGPPGGGSPTSVQEIEVTHSNKVVKFKTTGTIFLANQPGAKDSVIIKGTLAGPYRYLWFTAIWLMTLASRGNIQPINSGAITTLPSMGALGVAAVQVENLSKVGSEIMEQPSYESHQTFPLVTRHEIIPNCYIETFSYEENIENKKNVIKYDLFLRTYDKPTKFFQYGSAFGLGNSSKLKQVLYFFINVGYRTFKYFQERYSIDNKSWKTKNYYEVDAADVGTSLLMSAVAGAIL